MRRLILLLFSFATAGYAFAAPADLTNEIRAELLSNVTVIAPNSEFVVAVRLQMNPDWHTYWKNPGDGGLATEIKWEIPDGFTAGPIQWPAPERFTMTETMNYGYHDEVLLLTTFRAPEKLSAGEMVRIAAAVRWLGCNQICVVGKSNQSVLVRAAAAASASADAPRIAAAMRKVPAPLSEWKLHSWRHGTTLLLELVPVDGAHSANVKSLYFYPDDASVIEYAAPQHLEHVKGYLRLRLEVSNSASPGQPKILRGVVVGSEGWSGAPGTAFVVEAPVESASNNK